jgi:GTP-binding protein
MFIDELTIKARSGDGGDGVVRWLHMKGKEYGGPSGGNGGRGGSVFVRAVRDVHLLSKYRTKKIFNAPHGGDGQKDSLQGVSGDDLDILLPIGSIITNTETNEKVFLQKEGERVELLHGGHGGRGNESFKSSRNVSPRQFTEGKKGEQAEFHIEVELIADIGFIGLPSAGKTSLLNALTSAKGKVGDYPFTTLEPNLGEMYGYIIADIPGLIEGASDGKGLGHKFLRHIKRTKMLVHLISLEQEDPIASYKTIRNELKQFDPELLKKSEIIVLTKTDLIEDKDKIKEIIEKMKKLSNTVTTVSLYDDESLKSMSELLISEASE